MLGIYDASMTLSSESVSDLNWWMTTLPSACKNISIGNPTIEMATDASNLGWGAVCNGQSPQGMWTPLETQKHINELELLAVYFGLKSFLCLLKGKHVCVKSDNSTTVFYLNAMGGTKSPLCNKIAKSVWMCCVKNEIWLTACHVPGVLNFEADSSSNLAYFLRLLPSLVLLRLTCLHADLTTNFQNMFLGNLTLEHAMWMLFRFPGVGSLFTFFLHFLCLIDVCRNWKTIRL